jgi:hypothetical protein
MPIRFGSYKLQNYRPTSAKTGRLTFRFLFAYYTIEAERRCHEFTHCIHENGTARNSEPLGLIRPDFDSLLWLSRNAQALALLPATTTLR